MVTLYESFGNFNTEVSSYRLLISKRSRGIISLTENKFSFESQKDRILFHINLSEIQDFFLRHRFSIPLVELKTRDETIYSVYPLRKSKKSYHSSLLMTEDLFRELTRLIYYKEQTILFDAIGTIYPGSIQGVKMKHRASQGHIFITENTIFFKPFDHIKKEDIRVSDIKSIIMENVDSTTYVTLETLEGKLYSFLPLKKHWRKFVKDKVKTEKLYDILNQAKMYKESEKIGIELKNKSKCSYCGNIVTIEFITCPFCGNSI
ncbi:MAG: zinc ribbon domain-containing protein [Candidatus Heimdallarchaeota archaeon]